MRVNYIRMSVTYWPARILGLIQVQVEVSYQDWVLAPEEFLILLDIGEVGQSGWWEILSNDQGTGRASENLTAYHVCPVEACGLDNPPPHPVLQDWRHASLRSVGDGGPGCQKYNVLAQSILKIRCSGDLYIVEDHEVEPAKLDRLERLN